MEFIEDTSLIVKFFYLALALFNGGWMVFDGIHVLLTGKYFGPPQPGPWSQLVSGVGLNPFSLGPVFIFLGITWLVSSYGLVAGMGWAWYLSLAVALATLWYLPVGTILSLLAIAVLWLFRAHFP